MYLQSAHPRLRPHGPRDPHLHRAFDLAQARRAKGGRRRGHRLAPARLRRGQVPARLRRCGLLLLELWRRADKSSVAGRSRGSRRQSVAGRRPDSLPSCFACRSAPVSATSCDAPGACAATSRMFRTIRPAALTSAFAMMKPEANASVAPVGTGRTGMPRSRGGLTTSVEALPSCSRRRDCCKVFPRTRWPED